MKWTAIPLCRGSDESEKNASMLLLVRKGRAFFYQDDLFDEHVIR